MVQSLNTKVELTVDATSFMGLANYGKIMVGDKAFEFYDDQDVRKYIQIPWEEVEFVMATVLFKGKWIPRFAVQTKKNGRYQFAAKNPKKVLRAIQNHIGKKKMRRSLSFFQIFSRSLKAKFGKNK